LADLNWKLIFLLSGFGLVMGIATVFLIPSKIEPMFWLAIFIVCAYFISKQTEKPFSHGLLLGLANSVWITASHILFFNQYIANHPPGSGDDEFDAVAGFSESDDGPDRAGCGSRLRCGHGSIRIGCPQALKTPRP